MHITVYCSSSNDVERAFFEDASELGRRLAASGHTLVWGGGRVGLMGAVAQAVHAHGGRCIGVIPEFMKTVELCYDQADELVVTQTMRQRKEEMDRRADAFVVLPGGFGTLEELSEILVGRILGEHDRPIVLYNPSGFYDPLLTLFDHFIDHRFAKPGHLAHFIVAETLEDVMLGLEAD